MPTARAREAHSIIHGIGFLDCRSIVAKPFRKRGKISQEVSRCGDQKGPGERCGAPLGRSARLRLCVCGLAKTRKGVSPPLFSEPETGRCDRADYRRRMGHVLPIRTTEFREGAPFGSDRQRCFALGSAVKPFVYSCLFVVLFCLELGTW